MRDHSVESDFMWYLGEMTEEERKAFMDDIYERFCKLCMTKLDGEECYCAPEYDE